jgi:selenocysteine lyase/cysteine desulfurase
VNQLKDVPGISFLQSKPVHQSCAIANVAVAGKKPEEVAGELFSKHRIHTVAINWENIHGVRVTPNVYTSTRELDRLAAAIRKMRP